ncbi:ATP-binding protein [Kibdelosporangium persicum]|uniref:Serine-protein kinase RsbW n=1 Tax=Kibdelosporangium persicum TaxID=2698649 RepID=A0ABX2F7X8_9PSEU|nr:ATP-binding protein [Kibdelosporangium persicum]NRN67021.1 Serine-protein kinase RsbW [Kibdelosporangium persicum]
MRTTDRFRLTGDYGMALVVADLVTTVAGMGRLSKRQAYRLRLAADEITTNITCHGYCGEKGVVDIEGGVGDDWVWLHIEDEAPPFDPTHHCRVTVPDAVQEGGYGLFLAVTGIDHFAYDYSGGRNRNTLLVRRLPAHEDTLDGGTDDECHRAAGRRTGSVH